MKMTIFSERCHESECVKEDWKILTFDGWQKFFPIDWCFDASMKGHLEHKQKD